jgi:hypothetical protein
MKVPALPPEINGDPQVDLYDLSVKTYHDAVVLYYFYSHINYCLVLMEGNQQFLQQRVP